MSDQPLPADMARWPKDPFALLGVSHGVGRADLRRAYTRLVRAYKPDHFPEQFRRLRDAYEIIQSYIENEGWGEDDRAADEYDIDDAPPVADSLRSTAGNAVPSTRGAPVRALDEELAAAWQLACDGDPAAAYRQLTELHARAVGHVDLCLRLYWLLKLWPETDPIRTARDWLAQGMRRAASPGGPLGMLYLRELKRQPDAALDDRSDALLRDLAPGPWLAEFAEVRWRIAADYRWFDLIDQDLAALGPRMGQERGLWLRLLTLAAEAWARSSEDGASARFRQLRGEIECSPELGVGQQHDLVWLDFLADFVVQWSGSEDELFVPAGLARALNGAWGRDPVEYAAVLVAYLRELASGEKDDLDRLDFVLAHRPALAVRFGQALSAYAAFRGLEDPWPADLGDQAIDQFLDSVAWWRHDYHAARLLIYVFCRRELLPPERILDRLSERGPIDRLRPFLLSGRRSLSDALSPDWSLRYACLAHRLLHA